MKKSFAFLLVLLAFLASGACNREKMPAPLVGISCARTPEGVDQLSSQYTQAVSRAGGVPVIIPTVSTLEEARRVLSRLDGVIFSGGPDIDPAWYGESVWNETVEIDPKIVKIARERLFLGELERRFSTNANGRLRIVVDDAWSHLKNSKETYDLIVNDAFGGRRPMGGMDTQEGVRRSIAWYKENKWL